MKLQIIANIEIKSDSAAKRGGRTESVANNAAASKAGCICVVSLT